MADNVAVTEGSGKSVATDDVGGAQYQRVKIDGGGDGLAVPLIAGRQADASSFPVALSSEDVALVGALTETAPATDTASSGLNGRLQRIAQRITSLIALLPTALGANGGLKVEGIAGGVAVPVSLSSALVYNTGTFAVNGDVAHDGVDSGNPVKIGGRARSSEIGVVANNDRTDFVADLTGKQIVMPYANNENFISSTLITGTAANGMTGTTTTFLLQAPGAGLRNYITAVIISNSHPTTGTDVILQDSASGTTLATFPAAPAYGGATLALPVPLKQPTANVPLYVANLTAGANVKVTVIGYKGV